MERCMKASNRLRALAVARLPGLRVHERTLLVDMFDEGYALAGLSLRDVEVVIGRRLERIAKWDPAACMRQAEDDADHIERGGIGWVSWLDSWYPALLREIYDPPFGLFYRGEYPTAGPLPVAVVGTREPTGAAEKAAFELGLGLAELGVPVCSGLARGIDTAAHEGNSAGGAPGIAVLGNGIDRIYPASSRRAAMRLLEAGGCIFSEYPPDTPPARYHFPARNRIISGVSSGVVVVQAPAKSGALITAEFALEQGRDVYVHEEGMRGPVGVGSVRLEGMGAPIVRDAADIVARYREEVSGEESRENSRVAGTDTVSTGNRMAEELELEITGRSTRFRQARYPIRRHSGAA